MNLLNKFCIDCSELETSGKTQYIFSGMAFSDLSNAPIKGAVLLPFSFKGRSKSVNPCTFQEDLA
jgi:hypothetical protein